ncbi:uncharacterized protein [Triticum aestivum]|uniref:uncharacterized protein n=2 Tax=Triticum TaxID=4564 RepID=UPI001D00CD85|nr:uncharacterized protein LOC123129163 [Triticum aestivum]
MSATPSAPATQPGLGVSSTASTAHGQAAIANAKSKDPGWKYCICPDENKKNSLRCIYCNNLYTNGITRIKFHLGNIPNSGVLPCTKVPADVRDEIVEYLTRKGEKKAMKVTEQKRRRCEVDLSHSEGEGASDSDGTNNSVLVLKSARGTTSKSSSGPMEKFCKLTPKEAIAARKEKAADNIQLKLTTGRREQKRIRACEYICQFFYEACIPFNAVTLPSFDLMLESIGQYGEDLDGPSPYEMGGPYLKKRKKRVKDSFKAHKEHWELTGCTIMTDAWTDIRGRGVMNLVVHSAYGVVFLDSVDCSAAKKNGKYIFDLVDRCIEEIGEKHVVQVVTDNASVNQAASKLLNAKRPKVFWNGCAAHCIDLMLEDIGKLPSVDSTITKARAVTVFLYAHTRVLNLMREFLSKDLVRSGITRFATAYLNLKSMLDNKKQLQKLFRSDELDEMGYLKKVKGNEASKTVRSETFWRGVDIAVKFFEPLANLLRRMDSDVPAMGFIYGAFLDAKQEIKTKFENEQGSCFQEVLDIVDKRWDSKLKGPLHRAGYFLNPYYYYENKKQIELDGSFEAGLITCMEKMVEDVVLQDKINDELVAYRKEQGTFGREIAKRQRRNKSFDPAQWWSSHGSDSPNLRVLAMRILSLTCSSSACERNFSVFQQIHTKKRNRLLHNKMRDLVFIKFNSKLKQKRKMKNRDPIVDHTFVDVVEDEDNEWITGIVPHEPDEVVEVAASTSQGAVGASKRKRASQSRPRKKKKLLPVFREDELESASSSSESEDDAMHSPSGSSNESDSE